MARDQKLIVRRVWIERVECLAHTLCGPEAPGLIEIDESAGASRIREEVLRRTPEELKQLLEATWVCPVSAFYVETDGGDVYIVGETDWVQRAIRSGNYAWESK